MSLFRRGDIWWYELWFAGRRVQESTKSTSKAVARMAEQNRRRELEQGFNNLSDTRHERIRTFNELADEFFAAYKLRLPDSAVFAEYAVRYLKRLLGNKMLVDFSEGLVIDYQRAHRPRPSTKRLASCSGFSMSRARYFARDFGNGRCSS